MQLRWSSRTSWVVHGFALVAFACAMAFASATVANAASFTPAMQLPVPHWDTSQPQNAAMDASGTLWTIDLPRSRIVGFAPDGTERASWGGYGAVSGMLAIPTGIAVAPDQTIWVSDSGSPSRLQHFDRTGAVLGVIDLKNGINWAYPQGAAVDASGCVYVVMQSPSVVRKFSPDGTILMTIGNADGYHHSAEADSIGTPQDIALDADGNIYVTDRDWGDSRVIVFGPDGSFVRRITVAQSPDIGGCAIARNGDVLVASSAELFRFSKTGEYLGTIESFKPAQGYPTPGDVSVTPSGTIVWCDEGVMRFYDVAGVPQQVVGARVDPAPTPFGDTALHLHFESDGTGYSLDGATLHRFTDLGDFLGDLSIPSASGFTIDASSTIWTCNWDSMQLHHVTFDGTELPFSAEATGYGPGIVVDTDGSVLVFNKWTHSVAHYDPAGALLSEWRAEPEAVVNYISPGLMLPAPGGGVYFLQQPSLQANAEIRRYTSEGSQTAGFSVSPAPGTPGVYMSDFAIGPQGQFFICDAYDGDIRWFDANGAPGGSYKGPADRPFGYRSLQSIAFDPLGRLWVSEGPSLRSFDISGLEQPACETSPAAPAVDQTVTVSSSLPEQQGGQPETLTVGVQSSSDDATWTTVSTTAVSAEQPVSWTTRATGSTMHYRMVFSGASRGQLTVYSKTAAVKGKATTAPAAAKLSISAPKCASRVRLGKRLSVSGSASPTARTSGMFVRIDAYRWERLKHGRMGWVHRTSARVRASGGRYSAKLAFSRRGAWRMRAVLLGPSLASGWTAVRVH